MENYKLFRENGPDKSKRMLAAPVLAVVMVHDRDRAHGAEVQRHCPGRKPPKQAAKCRRRAPCKGAIAICH